MKPIQNLSENCLFWLTENSLLHVRIKQMIRQIRTETTPLHGSLLQESNRLLEEQIKAFELKIADADRRLVNVLKSDPACYPHSSTRGELTAESENTLYETMKSNYNSYVDLQRSVTNYLKRVSMSDHLRIIPLRAPEGLRVWESNIG